MGITKKPVSESSDDLIPDSIDEVVDNFMDFRRLDDPIFDLSAGEFVDEDDDLQRLSTPEEIFMSQSPYYQNTISPILTDQRSSNDSTRNLINSLYRHMVQENGSDSNSTFNPVFNLSAILSTNSINYSASTFTTNPVIDSTSTLTTNPDIDSTSTLTTNPDIDSTSTLTTNPDIDSTSTLTTNPDIDSTSSLTTNPDIDSTSTLNSNPDIDSTSTLTTNPDINSTSTLTTNPVIVTTTESINVTNVSATKPVTKPFIKKNGLHIGRKKANRANNESFLLSLSDDKQKHPEDEIFNNQNKNGFTKVINKFCIKPDLIESVIQGNDEELLMKKKRKSTPKKNKNRLERYFYPDQAFKNLTSSQRSLYKQKSLPLTAIRIIETELVKYFVLNPNGVYTSPPLPKYQRLLIHSISRFYALEAKSMNNRGRRTQKIVQVRNYGYTDFKPTNISLLEFVSAFLN